MEQAMRCNSLKCRQELKDHAVVTTCSHIFCINCSKGPDLSSESSGQIRKCPACKMHLTNPHDAVVTVLNPTEDYKTSVLSGLTPDIIMECAGRGLSFWAYQTIQEIVYQRYLANSLTDKYATLSTHMDKVIHDANMEISNLRTRMSNMQAEQDNLRRKNEELGQAIREKNRKHLQTQELYDKLKRRNMLGQVQKDASAAVDHIQASASAHRIFDRLENQASRTSEPPSFLNDNLAAGPGSQTVFSNAANKGAEMGNQSRRGSWAGISGYESAENRPLQTISTHRQCLGPGHGTSPRISLANRQPNMNTGTPMPHQRPSPRQPLSNLSSNGFSGNGLPGYGMSAGMKVSNSANGSSDGFIRPPLVRSRVAQRPSSAFPLNRNSAFGQLPPTNMFSNAQSYY